MLTETIFDRCPIWRLYSGTVLVLLAGSECGFRLGLLRRAKMSEGEKAPANAMMGSTLGLLAFMLAFTFGMSSTRFDARKQLVLDEASAILRAYERGQFLPEIQQIECTRLLREYVRIRVLPTTLKSIEKIREAVKRSEEIQKELWQLAASQADRPSAILAGFMGSLSELSDLQMKRVRAAVWNRIPPTIVVTLYVIAFLGLGTIGYGAGLAESRTTIPVAILALAFSAIIVLIIDLERPRQRLFEVSQEPMTDVARRIGVGQPYELNSK
jgi:hypothetical protein